MNFPRGELIFPIIPIPQGKFLQLFFDFCVFTLSWPQLARTALMRASHHNKSTGANYAALEQSMDLTKTSWDPF